jgi:hypothetical protein
MKYLDKGTRVHIVSRVKRLALSSTKRMVTGIQISRKLFRSRALAVVVVLGVLLAGLALSPSMRGMHTRGGSVAAFNESISTFASNDCTTAKTAWDLGQTACAVATGAPDDRRIAWVAPMAPSHS